MITSTEEPYHEIVYYAIAGLSPGNPSWCGRFDNFFTGAPPHLPFEETMIELAATLVVIYLGYRILMAVVVAIVAILEWMFE